MWEAFLAIAYKEFIQAARNKTRLKKVFVLQAMTFAMLGWIDLNVKNMPMVIVDQDRSAESRELVSRVAATRTFEIKYATSSTEQARGHIRAGRAKVALVIPAEYSRLRAAGENAQILALVDGSDSTASGEATNAIDGLAESMNTSSQQELVETPATLTVHPDVLYNPQRRNASFMLPGTLAIMIGFAYSMLVATGLSSEREGGNLERLLMTPIDYRGLILGKVAPYFVVGILNAAVYLVVIRFVFQVPMRGSMPLLMGALVLYVMTILSMASFIAAGARTTGDAMSLRGFLVFPALMLSGYIFPLASLPKVLLPISYALPQTHFIEIMRGICLRGAGAVELAPHLLYLVAMPVLFTLAAARRFSRSIMERSCAETRTSTMKESYGR